MVLRLLVDSCLTPAIVPRLIGRFRGEVDAVHVDAVLPPATPDSDVFAFAREEARLAMTANIRDFLGIARGSTDHHGGLILVEDQNTKRRRIEAALAIVEAVLHWMQAANSPEGHVFTWRRAGGGRLAIRKIP